VTTTAQNLPANILKDYLIISPPVEISIAHVITVIFPGVKFELFEDAVILINGISLPSYNQDRANPAAADESLSPSHNNRNVRRLYL